VVIAPSFGDIFRQNSLKIGLLPVQLPQEQVRELMTRSEITVDLESRKVDEFPFELDDFTRECLLEGLDDIALTLRDVELIDAYEAAHPAPLSTVTRG